MVQNIPSIQSTKNSIRQLQFEKAYSSIETAEEFFVIAKNMMLDMRAWQSEIVNQSIQFFITDSAGKVQHRLIHKGDLIRIVSSDSENEKVDWMCINALQYDDYPNENKEVLTMHLSQTKNQKPASSTECRENQYEIILSIERNHSHLISGMTICMSDEAYNSLNGLEMPFKNHLTWDHLLQNFLPEE
ncbi:MAG: hypothetical protein JSS78_06225 [Bacteroidetes bacterium]|nr:hypothetical protein [Bacteroidota bacterium]